MRDIVIRRWRRFWTGIAGPRGFGRIAAQLAALGTRPYHEKAFLSLLHPRGFIAPTASVSHPALRLGKHVYLGDRVIVTGLDEAGEVQLGDDVQIYGDTIILTAYRGRMRIGCGTHIQPGCHIYSCVSAIEIGSKVEIAARCAFYSYNHGVSLGAVIMDQPLTSKGRIIVGDGAWLGHGVTVLDGVRIGHGAVIGAGAVVVRDVPDNAIAAGVPARVIRERRA